MRGTTTDTGAIFSTKRFLLFRPHMRSRWPALAGLRPALLLLLLLLAASPEPTSTAPGRRWRGARHRRARNRDRAPVPIVQGAQASAAPAQTAVSLEAVQRLCACSPLSGKLRTYFKDVVLIVNTNYEFAVWATAPFWRRTFGRFFKHVLIMSPHGVKQLGVRGEGAWDEVRHRLRLYLVHCVEKVPLPEEPYLVHCAEKVVLPEQVLLSAFPVSASVEAEKFCLPRS